MDSIYINPFNRNYSSYNEHLIAFNRSFQNRISSDLKKLFNKDKGFSINTTGSDGRLEKGPVSPIEVLVLKRDNDFEEINNKLKEYICTYNGKNVFNKYLEQKNINQDPLYKCIVKDNENKLIEFISPNRIFDMRFIYGDNYIFSDALDIFNLELKSSKGKNLLKMLKKRVKEHTEINLSGKQEFKGNKIDHYCFNKGLVFYNPDENIWSFKQGPLRVIQYTLIKDMLKKIRQNFPKEIIFNLPKNVVEKLNRLEVEGLTNISSMELNDLTDSYKYFTHLYHKSQFLYERDKLKEMFFDVNEVKERCKSISDICSSEIIH